MNILHVGWGFSPWCWGGLIEYVEDLMETQKRHGDEVHYFFSGRHYPWIKKPRLLKWQRKGIPCYEIINSPILHATDLGIANPAFELEEPYSETFFRKVLEETKPEMVHIQTLLGFPSSLIEIAKAEFCLPLVMTLQDYFSLCPTIRLFDYSHERCTDRLIGDKCTICCQNAVGRNPLRVNTLIYEFRHFGSYPLLKWLYSFLAKHPALNDVKDQEKLPNKNVSEKFQRRRDVNLKRLQKIDLLITPSHRAEEIYKHFLGDSSRIKALPGTLRHFGDILPKKVETINPPIRFATLNGCSSIAKGALSIFGALRNLKERGLSSKFEFHIFGWIPRHLMDECLNWDNVFYHGTYQIKDLNRLLEEMDVGVVPSMWEEVYGYTGIEFLAKGIPIIGNHRGGIPEYALDRHTGWLNETASSEELAEIMNRIIDSPQKILDLNQNILDHRDQLVKTMEQHFSEMEAIYKKIMEDSRAYRPVSP